MQLTSRVLLENLPVSLLLHDFPTFYRTSRFITVFIGAFHWSLSWAKLIQFIESHHISLRLIFILSSNLHLGLPSGLFLSGFPTKNLFTLLFAPMHATCPAHFILLHSENKLSMITKASVENYHLIRILLRVITSIMLNTYHPQTVLMFISLPINVYTWMRNNSYGTAVHRIHVRYCTETLF